MNRLRTAEIARILPLVRGSETKSHMAYVHAVLEGNQDGKLFVDRADNPATALVCPASGFYFLFGAVDVVGLTRFLPELLAGHLVDKCAVFATSRAWRETLDPRFERHVARTGFEFRPPDPFPPLRWRDRLPTGCALSRMTPEVVAQWQRGLDPWVVHIHGGPEGFAARSFGHALLHEDRIVSFCAAGAIGGGEAEVEVGTVPDYRRRGLAELACLAFIEECKDRNLLPAWNCSAGNAASAALGRKLGFVEIEQIRGYPLEAEMRCVDGVWRLPS